jgi:hypothetical protein
LSSRHFLCLTSSVTRKLHLTRINTIICRTIRPGFLLLVAAGCLAACGQDCSRIGSTTIDSMKWTALHDYATKCLSAQQVTALDHQKALYDRVALSDMFRSKSVQEVLDNDRDWPATQKKAGEILELARDSDFSSVFQTPNADQGQSHSPTGPEILPYAVQFIFRDHRESSREPQNQKPDATSFIVSASNSSGGRQSTLLLVTARHVVEPSWRKCAAIPTVDESSKLSVRLNRRSGGVDFLPINLLTATGSKAYYVSEDDAIDLAVVPLNEAEIASYVVLTVPYRQIATESESSAITIGTALVTAGLQPDLAGKIGNTPIIKSGMLSDKRVEPAEVPCEDPLLRRKIRVWIVQGAFTAGLSGAPVFAVLNRASARTPVIIGVQSAEWPDASLSGITPSTYLTSLLQQAISNSSTTRK